MPQTGTLGGELLGSGSLAGQLPGGGGGSGTFTAPETLLLSDATTNTVPDTLIIRHTTSGTVAAGFGETEAVELQSAGGAVRRVMTDVISLTTATDAAEVAQRQVSLMNAGALSTVLTLAQSTNFPVGGSAAAPTLTVGPSRAGISGFGGALVFCFNGAQIGFWNGGSLTSSVPIASAGGLSGTTGAFSSDITGSGRLVMTPGATSSGALTKISMTPSADTGTTASTEAFDIDFDLSRTRTWSTGALTTQRAVRLKGPTYAFVGASTITSAATLAIESAPTAGANATITNSYALWVQAGATRIDGNFGFGVAPQPATVVAALTNNVASGGTNDTVANYTDLTVYANDSAAIRNDIFQLARKMSQVVTALKNNGVII